MKWILVLLLACGCSKKPDVADARGALKTLEALAAVPDASLALRLSYQACSELPSCAAGCADELSFCAGANSDEAQRGAVLGMCFSDAKGKPADAWFRHHFETFLDASRPLLSADEQRRFDTARAKK